MNAHAEVMGRFERPKVLEREGAAPQADVARRENKWNPKEFARQQIRGLVRQVFFGADAASTKQVVFSAVEADTNVTEICERVGEALALETRSHIAIVGRTGQAGEIEKGIPRFSGSAGLKQLSTRLSGNLWRVPCFRLRETSEEFGTGPYWLSCLAELRNEFEYAVIEAPAAGVSSEAALLGQLADGVILVLEAHSTRKAPARNIKERLGAQSRILGAVLSERRFPVPQAIYSRL